MTNSLQFLCLARFSLAFLGACHFALPSLRSRKAAPVFNTGAATKSMPPAEGLSPQAEPIVGQSGGTVRCCQ